MKIVITGGPGTGKTSIINKLEILATQYFMKAQGKLYRNTKN